jgi:hypothetical protein
MLVKFCFQKSYLHIPPFFFKSDNNNGYLYEDLAFVHPSLAYLPKYLSEQKLFQTQVIE